ncbi:MAG: shikimate dehydrogenase [Verrucomicrobiales bacterium]|jgi:shikimate dehydrogenase|nr:shikimate dehydrogenase [Verrucomicrobiales bacterium]
MDQIYSPDSLGELAGGGPLYGVIGFPVQHSLSPAMHTAAFARCKLDARYVAVEVPPEQLAATVARMKTLPFTGWNCTLPHKIALAGLMDGIDDTARRLGGVNTVFNDNGRLAGFNTDGEGWVRAVREEFSLDVRDLRVMILGLGGAGRAVAAQAALEQCEKLVLVNRTMAKAQELRAQLAPQFDSEKLLGADTRLKVVPWDETLIARELDQIDLVVNCTSLGLRASDAAVLPARILQPHLCVHDMVYRPARTKLLAAAREAGARGANGLSMLVHQGALSFEIWTGQTAPLTAMRNALRAAANAK